MVQGVQSEALPAAKASLWTPGPQLVHGYIMRLMGRVVTMSIKTVETVRELLTIE